MSLARVTVAAVALCATVAAVGIWGPRPSPSPQGDELGPERGETAEAYQARAAATITGSEPTYALVSFEGGLGPERTAEAVGEAERLAAVIIGQAAPIAVPEPAGNATRRDVLDTVLGRVAASLAGIGNVSAPTTFSAAIVYGEPEALRAIEQSPGVLAVEAVPADSAWGAFALRPPGYHGQL